jgi:thymidylate kinase
MEHRTTIDLTKLPVIGFEGVDGAGKDFAIKLLKTHFEQQGVPVVVAESIPYEFFVDKAHSSQWYNLHNVNIRYMQFLAYEVNNYYKNIQPFEGKAVVLVNRFIPSCFAYNSLEPITGFTDAMKDMMRVLCEEFYKPDVTFWFDVPNEVLLDRFARTRQHEKTPDLTFVDKVRAQYGLFQEKYGIRYSMIKIDGTMTAERTLNEMLQIIDSIINELDTVGTETGYDVL